MKKIFILALFAFVAPYLAGLDALTMKSKFTHAECGDFIVSDQKGSLSLIFIKESDTKKIVLEEISFPKRAKPKKKGIAGWQEWLDKGAPGHTSWIDIEIDLAESSILECFSFSRDAWLSLSSSESFLLRLFDLKLYKIPDHELKKIGPPPEKGPDNRKMWLPQLVFDGVKERGRAFDIFRIDWPKDETPLSGLQVEVYFNQKDKLFPFPYLVRVRDKTDASLSFRVLDSGKGIRSPKGELPRRKFTFSKVNMSDENQIKLEISCPAYYKKFSLFAIDPNDPINGNIAIPFEMSRNGELVTFLLDKPFLKKKLKSFHSYSFAITADEPSLVSITTRELFTP